MASCAHAIAHAFDVQSAGLSALTFFALIGSVEEIVERLHQRRERWGYSYYTVQQPSAHEFAPILAALTPR